MKDIIAYSLSLLNCVALKLNSLLKRKYDVIRKGCTEWIENISFDAAARTHLEGGNIGRIDECL